MKIFRKWQPNKYIRKDYGLQIRHAKIGVIQLWFKWLWWTTFNDKNPSWKETKQLAKDGELVVKHLFVLCPAPMYTTFFYLT